MRARPATAPSSTGVCSGAVCGGAPLLLWCAARFPLRPAPLYQHPPASNHRMSRDQRMRDNWALLHALEEAGRRSAPAAVAFNLVPEFLGAGARQFVFMLKGLQEIAPRLEAAGIPFFLLRVRLAFGSAGYACSGQRRRGWTSCVAAL
jgi:hypothetical protein